VGEEIKKNKGGNKRSKRSLIQRIDFVHVYIENPTKKSRGRNGGQGGGGSKSPLKEDLSGRREAQSKERKLGFLPIDLTRTEKLGGIGRGFVWFWEGSWEALTWEVKNNKTLTIRL